MKKQVQERIDTICLVTKNKFSKQNSRKQFQQQQVDSNLLRQNSLHNGVVFMQLTHINYNKSLNLCEQVEVVERNV